MKHNEIYDLIWISTCIDEDNIYNLINSLCYNDKLKMKLVLVAQNNINITKVFDHPGNNSVVIIPVEKKLPLSEARNIGLKHIFDKCVEYRYIMFPDDDSTFNRSFFEDFNKHITSNSLIQVLTRENLHNKYLSLPRFRKKVISVLDHKYAISVNIICNKSTVDRIRFFDETMGVGCYYGAGEDRDFFLRASRIEEFLFVPELSSIHPDQTKLDMTYDYDALIKRYKSYGRGVVYMFFKNGMHIQCISISLRALLGSFKCLLSGRLMMSRIYYISCVDRIRTYMSLIMNKNND